jgi:hypothetical protein
VHYKYAAKDKKTQVEEEKELIRRVQQFDDKLAMKRLISGYEELLRKAVMDSGVTTSGSNIDSMTAMNYAQSYAKRYIKTYDESKNVQPNTYIYNNVKMQLKNIKSEYREGISHMSNQLTDDLALDRKAREWLTDMGIEPTVENTFNFVKNEFGKGREKSTVDSFARARKMERRELSGNQILGGDEGGDVMTQAEYLSSRGEKSGEELFADHQKRLQIETAINSPEFTHQERDYISHLAGIGRYAMNPTSNRNIAALNAGITYAQGMAAIKKLQTKLGV